MVLVQVYMLNMKHLLSPTSVQQQNQTWFCIFSRLTFKFSIFSRLRNWPRVKWGDLTAAFQYLKGAYKNDGDKFLAGHVAIGQGLMVLN